MGYSVGAIGAIAVLFLFGRPGSAQSLPYHQLSAEEFKGMPNISSGDIVAYTNCFIDFNYHATSQKGIYRLNCNIKLVFDKNKSWINKRKVLSSTMLEQVLNHEQGHYILAYMEQQELIRTVSKTRFDANYQYEAANLFDRVHEKYKQLSLDYDDDTSHMLNKQQQHSWDEYFKRRLEYMPPAELARR
ncbi:MAG TPA: hypothetical protein VGC01_00400 [Mucilaginibacter sp.]